MARKPNYNFERMERERLKAAKLAEKAAAKREEREALLETYMAALGQLADTPLGKAAQERF